MNKRQCEQCSGKLGLGARFKNLWNGKSWEHFRFCSKHCEQLHERTRANRSRETRWISYLGSART
jgi:hypothetical protein